MAAKKSGRARCGKCQVVLHDPLRTRQPTPAEQRELDATQGTDKGRLMYRYQGSRRRDLEKNLAPTGDPAQTVLTCKKCTLAYEPADYLSRLMDAAELGQDLWLTRADLKR